MNTSTIYPEDDQFASPYEERMAFAFADAMERIEAGDVADSVLNGLDAAMAAELHSLLRVGEFLFAMQHAPLPVRSSEHLSKRRAHFIDQIALEKMRQEIDDASTVSAATRTAKPILQPAPARPKQRSQAGMAGWWNRAVEGFALGNLRLAPVVATLAIVFTSVFGLWRVSSASLPGDLTYPIKSWVTMMNLSFTAPDQRAASSQASAAAIQNDFTASAQRAQERATAGAEIAGVTHQESVFLVFDGFDGRLLKFGDIRVVPSWQPNPASESRSNMEIVGDLQPGAEVWLTVQILPGQADIVQGVRAEVKSESDQAAASDAATPVSCVASRPAGWKFHTVLRGETLSSLSESSGASERAIAGANCLDSDSIFAGQMLFLP